MAVVSVYLRILSHVCKKEVHKIKRNTKLISSLFSGLYFSLLAGFYQIYLVRIEKLIGCRIKHNHYRIFIRL